MEDQRRFSVGKLPWSYMVTIMLTSEASDSRKEADLEKWDLSVHSLGDKD